jgi:hypothetical protein
VLVSFGILRGDEESEFALNESQLDSLQYTDLKDCCERSYSLSAAAPDFHIFLVLSSEDSQHLRLTRDTMDERNCSLVLLDAWSTGAAPSIQELLVKDRLRKISQRQGRVRLCLLESGARLPSQLSGSCDFWRGWPKSFVSNDSQERMHVAVSSRNATTDLSRDGQSHLPPRSNSTVENSTSSDNETAEDMRSRESTITDELLDKAGLEHLPRDSVLSFLSSRFSMDSLEDGRRALDDKTGCGAVLRSNSSRRQLLKAKRRLQVPVRGPPFVLRGKVKSNARLSRRRWKCKQ